MNIYRILYDNELVFLKNKMIRDLNEILIETGKRKIDKLCDSEIKQIVKIHPAVDLNEPVKEINGIVCQECFNAEATMRKGDDEIEMCSDCYNKAEQ